MRRGIHERLLWPASSGASCSCRQYVGKLAMTAIDYPPMQDPATFNLDAMKKKIEAMMKEHEGQ